MFARVRVFPAALFSLILLAAVLITPGSLLAQAGPVYNPATGHWYQMVTRPDLVHWSAARYEAQALTHQGQPGYLAVVTSAEENQFLINAFPQAVAQGYLLGGAQTFGSPETEGGWEWVTGEPWANPPWDDYQPDDSIDPSGVAYASNGLWNDIAVYGLAPGFIAEFGINPPLVPPIVFEPLRKLAVIAPGDVSAFDFDDDGKPDLAASSNLDVALLFGNGDGTFSSPQYLGLNNSLLSDQTIGSDVNRDGRTDVVIASGDSVYVFRNLGARTYAAPQRHLAAGRSFGVHAADLTGDAMPELLICDHDASRMGVLLNNGAGGFSAPTYYATGSLPGRIVTADWNRDGRTDVAITNTLGGNVSLFAGNGSGSLAPRGAVSTGGVYPVNIVTTDFNRDGLLDLIVANTFSHTVSIMYGNGNGTFQPGVTYPGNTYPHILCAQDLDGDGDSDLAAPNNGSHYFTFHRNNAGVPGPPQIMRAGGRNARTMATADFNRDGRPDLAVGCEDSDVISVFLNVTGFPPPAVPSSLTAVADSASRIDLAWLDLSTSEFQFKIERRAAGGVYQQIATVPGAPSNGTIVTYADQSGLSPDTTYSYRVRANSSIGESLYSSEASATTFPNPPTAPSNLTATPVSHARVDLAWQDNSANETGFTVERRTGGGAYSVQANLAANVVAHSDLDVTAQTTYIYRVRANNATGPSTHTNEATAVTPDRTTDAPVELSAAAVSSTVIRVAWRDQSVNETEFRIERKPAGGVFAQIGTRGPRAGARGFATYDDASGLTANSTYVYRVRAVGALGVSGYSNEATASTTPVPPAAPTDLTATLTTSTSITLAWTDNSSNETGFSVERRAGGAGAFTFIGVSDADTPNFPDPGLATDTLYTYRVRALGASGVSDYSNEALSGTTPTAPTGLTAQGGVTQVALQWVDNSQSETGFKIERKSGQSFVLVKTTGAGAVSYVDTGLQSGTNYTYRVRATNPGGDSGPTSEQLGQTHPSAPTSLVVSTLNASRLALSWVDTNPSPPSAKIERALSPGGPFGQVGVAAAGVTVFQDTALSAATTYYYRVRATNLAGDSGYSNIAFASTTPAAPAAPSTLTGVALSGRKVRLSWQDNSSNESGFEIWRLDPGGAGFQIQVFVTAGQATYLDTSVSGNATYRYRVRATNSGGPSLYSSTVDVTTPVEVPAAPTGLTVTGMSHNQLRVQWTDASDNETGFVLERKPAGGAFVLAATVGANASQYFDGGLVEASTYTYRVKSINANGGSEPSSEASGATLPDTPTNLTATPGSQRVDLAWVDKSSGETGYSIERRTGAGGAFTVIGSVAANVSVYGDASAATGVTYTYRVRATGSGLPSTYSNEATASPLAQTPLAKLVISPKRLSFGTVRVGSLKQKKLKVTNKGKEPLMVSVPNPTAPFSLVSGGGNVTLAPRQSHTVLVRYSPTAAGAANGTLTLSSTDPRALQAAVSLVGKGR